MHTDAPAPAPADPAVDSDVAPAGDLSIEMMFDLLMGDAPAVMPGVFIGDWMVRKQSADAALAAVESAGAKLRRKLPLLQVHVQADDVAKRDGQHPLWCQTHRVFGCPESNNMFAVRPCWQAPCPAVHIQVTAEGLPLFDGAWRVGGILKSDANGVVTSHSIGADGAALALAHRDLAGECEHCGLTRRRSTTVLLHNVETGEVRPVGKSCLTDYTGGSMRPEILETLTNLGERFAQAFGVVIGDEPESAPVVDIVALAMRYIAVDGFVRTGDSFEAPTAACVRGALLWDGKTGRRPAILASDLTDADRARATDAIVAISDPNLDSDRDRGSEYLANLRAVCELEWAQIEGRGNKVGLLASLPVAAERRAAQLERAAVEQARTEAAVNAWIGEPRQRREFTGEVVTSMTVDTDWGVSDLLVVNTPEGQVKAFGKIDGREDVNRGDSVTFVATIKKEGAHGEYKGMRQTNVNRVKFA